MTSLNTFKYIEEIPHFEDLYEIRKKTDDVISMIYALSEGYDVAQRACDLISSIENLQETCKRICVCEE